MRTSLITALVMIALSCYPTPAGDISIGSKDTSHIDITAYFGESSEHANAIDRIAAWFCRDLELKSKDNPYNVAIITGEDDKTEINVSGIYIVEAEIIHSGWKVERPFYIPFILFTYRNNYKIEMIVRIYHQDEEKPKLIKRYNEKSKGPIVFQLFESNRNDGGLMVTYSRRTELENRAEHKLAEKLANDLHKTIKKYRS